MSIPLGFPGTNLYKTNIHLNSILIKNYIENIMKFLGRKYCFINGAFVIEDNDDNLHELLFSVKNNILSKSIQSHTKYKSKYDKMYEIHMSDNEINIKCFCDEHYISFAERKIHNIKWYSFTENSNKFIYLKLESSAKTKSLSHIANATSRYILKNSNTSCVIPRREDCEKDKTGCIFNKEHENPFYIPNTIILNNESPSEIFETYTRSGDEVFIPTHLSNFVLLNSSNELLFTHSNNGNTVSIEVKISGGRIKKKHRTKHRTNHRTKHRTKHKTKYRINRTRHK